MVTLAVLTWLAGALTQMMAPPPAPPPPVPPPRVASAGAEAGQRAFRMCAPCHSVVPSGPNAVGPNLFGVMDRPAGRVGGYRYSNVLMRRADTGLVWDEDTMRSYLTDPRAFLPGGSMAFAGVRDAQRMADLIAYLRTLK
jgi:cytochrome c